MMRSIFSRSFPGFPGTCLVLFALLLLPLSPAAETPPPDETPAYARVEAGHSGMWFDPSRSGEGWMLEVRPDDAAVVYWFTFDDEGKPRWLTGSGRIERGENGDEIRFDELIAVHGPAFGPDYDPDDAVFERQGQASFRFLDCDRAEIHFDAYGQQLEVPLFHLTRTMGAKGCRPIHGIPGEPVQPHAGQSGSWYDPAYNGQGFALGWMPNGDAALVWFTFDAEGRPYWLTGVGQLGDDERIVFDELEAVRGGRFGEAFDPDEVVRSHWGRIELTLECDVGQAHYFPTEEGFAEGRFDLQRLTRLESPDCPWVKPKLTDLYDFEWTELPVPPVISPLPHEAVNFKITSLADDGTVVGEAYWYGWRGIVRLRPGETEWEKMLQDGEKAFITPDGKTIYAIRNVPSPPEETVRDEYSKLMIWSEASGFSHAPGMTFPSNIVYGISKNGKWLTGEAFSLNGAGAVHAWKWSKDTGQIALEQWGAPFGISDDGAIAVGIEVTPPNRANIWINGKRQPMFDNNGVQLGFAWTCNSDCSMVVGHHQYPMNSWPESYRPWYRTGSGIVNYIDIPENSDESISTSASDDGSLIAGGHLIWDQALARYTEEGWLWTEDTGTVSLRDILGNL